MNKSTAGGKGKAGAGKAASNAKKQEQKVVSPNAKKQERTSVGAKKQE